MNKYLVVFCLHNAKNGGWAYKVDSAYDNYVDAYNKFCDLGKTYIRNGGDFDKVSLLLTDSDWRFYDSKVVPIEVAPIEE